MHYAWFSHGGSHFRIICFLWQNIRESQYAQFAVRNYKYLVDRHTHKLSKVINFRSLRKNRKVAMTLRDFSLGSITGLFCRDFCHDLIMGGFNITCIVWYSQCLHSLDLSQSSKIFPNNILTWVFMSSHNTLFHYNISGNVLRFMTPTWAVCFHKRIMATFM